MKYTTTSLGFGAASGTLYYLSKEQNINHLSNYLTSFGILNLFIIAAYYSINCIKFLVFGNVSPNEIKYLKDKIYYTSYEFIIGLLMIKFLGQSNLSLVDDFIPLQQRDFIKYLCLFCCVFLLKCFHHLSIIRINNLVQLNALTEITKLRFTLGVMIMNLTDIQLILLFAHEAMSPINNTSNPLLLIFGFEILNLYPSICISSVMLLLNFLKFPQTMQVHSLKSLEILNDLFRFCSFLIFNSIFIKSFTIPTIHLLPNIYSCLKLLILNTRNLIRVRKNSLFFSKVFNSSKSLDVTQCSEDICAICRDKLSSIGDEDEEERGPRELKCGHLFHWDCLKGWMLHSSACPYCRKALL